MATRFFGDAKPWVRITKRVKETKGEPLHSGESEGFAPPPSTPGSS